MRRLIQRFLMLVAFLASLQCDKINPPNGNVKLSVLYPETVVENGTISRIQVPGSGAEVRLYDSNAQCWGIRDARIDVAWVNGKPVGSIYSEITNENGNTLFKNIPEGHYYLVVFSRQLTKYTEKYIDVIGGDTLRLTKSFTDDGAYYNKLEPWDHEVPSVYPEPRALGSRSAY